MNTVSDPERRLSEPMTPAQIFFSFRGRIPRKTFWLYGVIALLGLAVYGNLLLGIVGMQEQHIEGVVNGVLLWPALAISAKRWHDRDKSGWWVLVLLVPVIGTLWTLIENGLMRGTAGPNRFGDDMTGRL
jgi:uncharacterized membrane protein YhaH (DUF805 family)